MTPSADTLQLTLSLAADATTDLAEIRELTMRLYDEMQGSTTVENEIFANTLSGITITGGGNLTVRNNPINKNGYQAIWVYKGGGGRFEQNDLRDNQQGAWEIDDDCLPNVTRVGNIE